MSNVIMLSPEQGQRAIRLNWMATEIAKSLGLPIRIPTALIGDTGCGKTDSVREFYQTLKSTLDVAKFWPHRLGHLLPEDLGGYPTRSEGRLIHAMMGSLPFDCDDVGVIFLDEFDRCPIENQNAALPLVYGDEFHGHRISPNAYVCLAMNGSADTYTTPLSQAAATRVCSIFISRNADGGNQSYQDWAKRNNMPSIARAFHEYHNEDIKSSTEFEEIAVATSRTVDMAGMISLARKKLDGKMKTDDVYFACIAGVIGLVAASKFVALEEVLESVNVDSILQSPETAAIAPESVYLFVVNMCLASMVDKPDSRTMSNNLVKYVARHRNQEMRKICADRIVAKYPSVIMTPAWQQVIK